MHWDIRAVPGPLCSETSKNTTQQLTSLTILVVILLLTPGKCKGEREVRNEEGI